MKKFHAIWSQRGGCDYTIGCGIQVELIEAENLEDARRQVYTKFASEEICDEVAKSILYVALYELADRDGLHITSALLMSERMLIDEARKVAQHTIEERAIYDRLRQKFEK